MPVRSNELGDNKSPLVSIGMPVFNGEKYIRSALDSILSQTFTNFELIISDNASTDSTCEICAEYVDKDNRVRFFKQDKNIGALPNFQFTLCQAVGVYFKWVAADDYLENKKTLENLISMADGYDLVIPDVDILNEKSGNRSMSLIASVFDPDSSSPFVDIALKYPSYVFYGLFKTSRLLDYFCILESNADLACFGEGIFVHKVVRDFKCSFAANSKIVYRRHQGNLSSSVSPKSLLADFITYSWRVFRLYCEVRYRGSLEFRKLLGLFLVHLRFVYVLLFLLLGWKKRV